MQNRSMASIKRILSLLCILIAVSCEQESERSSYLAEATSGTGQLCNKEDVALYVALRSEAGSDTTVNGWRIIAPQECKSISDWLNLKSTKSYYIQSEKGLYIPSGHSYSPERYDIICLPFDISLASSLSYTYNGTAVANSGYCPSGFARYQVTGLGTADPDYPDDDAINLSYTLAGGSFDGSQRINSQPVDKGKSYEQVEQELEAIKRQHEKIKSDFEICESKVQAIIALGDVFKVKLTDLDAIKDPCGYNFNDIEELKEKIRVFRREAFDGIKSIALEMRKLYQTVLARSQAFGVVEPIKNFIDQLGMGALIRPAVDANKSNPSFFQSVLDKYKEAFAKYYQQDTKSFFVSVLGYFSTFASFGEDYVATENIDEKSYLDYLKAVENGENYFDSIDFDKADYGYNWDSPIDPEIRSAVHNSLVPLDPVEGLEIEKELKTWNGSLTQKRKEILQVLGELIKARIAMERKASQEAALAVLKLRAITSGLREGLKEAPEFGKCVATSTVFNDFADMYAIVYAKDICTGDNLTPTGQVISGIGIVFGTAKVWREVIEEAGFAVRTQRALKEAAETAESAGSVLGSREGVDNFIDIVKTDVTAAGERLQDTIKNMKHPQIWTNSKKRSSVKNAYEHFKKHRSEFPQFKNAIEYVEGAHEFMNNPPAGTLIKTRANGEKVFYHQASETFAVLNTDEIPKTMFKPDPAVHGYPTNLDYFNAQ